MAFPITVESFFVLTPVLPWALLSIGLSVMEGALTGRDRAGLRIRLYNAACGLTVCLALFVASPVIRGATQASFTATGGPLTTLPRFGHPWLDMVIGCLAFIALRDLLFYWWHRAEHKVQLLWHIHAVHHSEERMTATSYMRQNWLEGLCQAFVVQLPAVLLLRLTPEAQLMAYMVGTAWDFLAHADFRIDLRRFTPVLTGPQLHRLHHSKLPQHLDTNFAQFFPLWDVIFGTYRAPAPAEFPPTGLASGDRLTGVIPLLTWPFRQWAGRRRENVTTSQ